MAVGPLAVTKMGDGVRGHCVLPRTVDLIVNTVVAEVRLAGVVAVAAVVVLGIVVGNFVVERGSAADKSSSPSLTGK